MREFFLSIYPWIKALHIISVIAWMAGMMYLPRLFIYHFQSQKDGEAERFFKTMEQRLLKGIINPAMIAVWLFAGLMLIANPGLLTTPWFLIKLAAVTGISAIHGIYAGAYKKFDKGEHPKSEKYWRIINEVPFVLLIIVVFLVVLKPVW